MEYCVNSPARQQVEVALHVAWIDGVVFFRPELQRVDEDADDRAVRGFEAVIDQAEVSLVQKTHRRY